MFGSGANSAAASRAEPRFALDNDTNVQ